MSDTKYTPGPWHVDGIHIGGGSPSYILASMSRCGTCEMVANARLIAAAPDLLEALKTMLGIGPPSVHTDFAEMEKAYLLALAAIEKAE